MKYLIAFLFVFSLFPLSALADLSLKANIPSGNFSSHIEIYLLSSEKNAKIFYYTDGEWRIDNILQYTKPILLKQDTQLHFFATSSDFRDTPIYENNYTFSYPKNIEIIPSKNSLEIKNTGNEVINIGYWKIESQNISYTITPYTYIEPQKSYKKDIPFMENEKITLFSPDNTVQISKTLSLEKKEDKLPENITPKSLETKEEISSWENWENFEEEEHNTQNLKEEISNNSLNKELNPEDIIEKTEEKKPFLENNLQANISNTDKNHGGIIIFFIIVFIIWISKLLPAIITYFTQNNTPKK